MCIITIPKVEGCPLHSPNSNRNISPQCKFLSKHVECGVLLGQYMCRTFAQNVCFLLENLKVEIFSIPALGSFLSKKIFIFFFKIMTYSDF